MAIKDVERDEIEFITKTLDCLPIANIEHFGSEKLVSEACVEKTLFNQVLTLSESGLLSFANAKKNAQYAEHLERGSNLIAACMDYIAEEVEAAPNVKEPPGHLKSA